MDHDLPQVVGVDRVEHIEKVLSRWALILGISVREVLCELFVSLELWKELAHTQLVVVGYRNLIYGNLLEQLLLAAEHCLKEVFVHGRLIRQIVLQMSTQILVRIEMVTYLSR